MKKVLLLFTLSFFTLTQAQSVFAPIGSTWNYTWYEHTGAYQGPKTLYYTGDTTVSSVTYKKIASAYVYSCVCPNWMIGSYYYDYILERNDSIFKAYPGSTTLELLYSFNQPIGDSILFTSGIPYKIVLDSVKTNFICSANRRVLYYTKYENGCTDSVRIIEGIGPVNDYLFSQGIGNCELGPGEYDFNCANITTCSYPSSCSPAVPLAVSNIKNPTNTIVIHKDHHLSVTFSKSQTGELTLHDVAGRISITEKFNQKTNIGLSTLNLKQGIYFLTVKSEEGDFYKKIFVE